MTGSRADARESVRPKMLQPRPSRGCQSIEQGVNADIFDATARPLQEHFDWMVALAVGHMDTVTLRSTSSTTGIHPCACEDLGQVLCYFDLYECFRVSFRGIL